MALIRSCVLASGSEGNVTFIETTNHKILIDAGMNVKYIKERLQEIASSLDDIDYILITHVHDDHTKSLPGIIKKYHPYICLSPKMYSELEFLKDYDKIILYNEKIELDDVTVEIIKTSHDTSDSRGFILRSENKSLTYVTDTGFINQKYFTQLSNCNLYFFESNHDIEMLLNGPYPKWLKDRVIGPYGHLSNKDSAIYLAKIIGDNTKKIVLMHLSHKNNTKEIALETINEIFREYDKKFDNIVCANQREKSEVFYL